MNAYDESAYGDAYAELYDSVQGTRDLDDCVDFIESLVPGGAKIFELGIGTGRVAIPLAKRGYRVSGNDISQRMLDQLIAKEHGDEIRVFTGDMADGLGEREYALVYVVFGTLACVTDPERQLETIRHVGEALEPDGLFLVEANVPDIETFVGGKKVEMGYLREDQVMISCHQLDPVAQTIRSQHLLVRDGKLATIPIVFRYLWPRELELMCRAAGLELVERWADFRRTPLHPRAERFVSVFRLARAGEPTFS